MKTAEVLRQRLEMIYRWHGGMVNPDTGMLEYLYFPQTDAFVRERCPIREIASVWDVERVSHFLNRRELFPLVEKSLRHYDDYLVGREGYLILDPGRMGEPSSIAHSAFTILALTGAPAPLKTRRITALAGYDAQYFRRGRVARDILVFFANWQSQACRLLFEFTT